MVWANDPAADFCSRLGVLRLSIHQVLGGGSLSAQKSEQCRWRVIERDRGIADAGRDISIFEEISEYEMFGSSLEIKAAIASADPGLNNQPWFVWSPVNAIRRNHDKPPRNL